MRRAVSHLPLRIVLLMGMMYQAGGYQVQTTQTPGQATSTEAKLENFILHVDIYHSESVPRNLPAEEVATFIRTHVGPTAELRPLLQTEKVVDFYDLQSLTGYLRELVRALGANPAKLRPAVIATRILALVGAPADVTIAASAFQHFAPRAATLADLQELLLLYDALNGAADITPLRNRAGAMVSALEAQPNRGAEAGMELQRLDEWLRITLPRAEKAQQLKAQLLSLENRQQRLAEEIKAYLTLQYGYIEFLQPWAARRLRRETWEDQPAQQITPTDNPRLRQDVATAFDRALQSVEDPGLRVRCLRAIAFFGGTLTPEQQAFVEKNAGMQIDKLAR